MRKMRSFCSASLEVATSFENECRGAAQQFSNT